MYSWIQENSPSVSHVSCSWLKSWKRSTGGREETSKEVILYVQLDVNKMHMWRLRYLPGLPDILDRMKESVRSKRKNSSNQHCFYLQIPEGATLFPCISFWLPSTVCLRAHFHATSVRTQTKRGLSEVRRLRALVRVHGAQIIESRKWKERDRLAHRSTFVCPKSGNHLEWTRAAAFLPSCKVKVYTPNKTNVGVRWTRKQNSCKRRKKRDRSAST